MGVFDKKSKEAEPVMVNNQYIRCQICGSDKFFSRRAQLNTAAASFLDFDWANPSADCYVCDQCGYIHWFLPNKKKEQ